MVKIKVGDVVTLGSGGVKMTVSEIVNNMVDCKWFNKEGELRVNSFFKEELRIDLYK